MRKRHVAAWIVVLPLVGRTLAGCSSTDTAAGEDGSASDASSEASGSETGAPERDQDATLKDGSTSVLTDASGDAEAYEPDGALDGDADAIGASDGDGDVVDADDGPEVEGGTDGEAGTDAEAGASAGDAGLTATEQLLNAVSPTCLSCALTHGALDPSGNGATCEGTVDTTFDATQTADCIAVLSCELSSRCASTGDTTSCLCGTVDPDTCYDDTGATTLNGACTTAFYAAYGSQDVSQYDESPAAPAGSGDWLAGLLGYDCSACFAVVAR